MTEPLLRIAGLSVRFPYRDGRVSWVVRDIDLEIMPGEIFGLTGESGSGKTMLGQAVMGLLPKGAVAEGSVRFKERDLLKLSEGELRRLRGDRLGMVFQDPMTAFNQTLRVGYQVAEPFMIHRQESEARARRRSPQLLAQVHVADPETRANQYPFELSGGMLQRALIASAIALRPEILIADEPTTGLDVTIQAGVLALFKQMRDELGAAILLITHDLGVVAETCDRVAVMYAGEVVETGPVEEVVNFPRHPYTQALIRATPEVTQAQGDLEPIPGSLPSPEDLRVRCRFIDRCPQAISICENHPKLERIGERSQVRCWVATGKGQ